MAECSRFYHSFRRIRPGEEPEAALSQSLQILSAVKEVGLILAPEVVSWEIPLVDGNTKLVRHRQTRICFTELQQHELKEHSKTFGPISLEFPTNTLRQIAALPVIYIPQTVGDDRFLSSAGSTLVWMFELIRKTLDQLDQLKRLADPATAHGVLGIASATPFAENYTLNLRNTDENGNVVQEITVPAETIRGVLDHIGYKNAPFAMMRGATFAAQTLFYPTDDKLHDSVLAYYRQREWRLISGFNVEGTENTRPLADEEKRRLLAIDQKFWTRELEDDRGKFSRIDEARLITSFQGKPLEDALSAVLVPPQAYDMARTLFGERVKIADDCREL